MLCDMNEMRGLGMRDMKITGMRAAGVFSAALLGVVMLAQPGRLVAQGTASIHGKVTNPAGMAVANAEVRLTTEKNPNTANPKFDYSFPTDAGGNYKGADIKPGTYMAVVYQGANHVDFMPADACGWGRQDDRLRYDPQRVHRQDESRGSRGA